MIAANSEVPFHQRLKSQSGPNPARLHQVGVPVKVIPSPASAQSQFPSKARSLPAETQLCQIMQDTARRARSVNGSDVEGGKIAS
jgi:hypothetical protein